MGTGKWIGAGMGFWFLGGPIGALVGFALGSLWDSNSSSKSSSKANWQKRAQNSQYNYGLDAFNSSLLVLTAAVMNADGKVLKTELDFVKGFLLQNFGEEKAKKNLIILRQLLQKPVPVRQVALQINQYLDHPQRLQLMQFLVGIAKSDGHLHPSEEQLIRTIGNYLNIGARDMASIFGMHQSSGQTDYYKVLGLSKSASDQEVKKAYRSLAVKFHPDKVTSLGESYRKAAEEKFKKISEAYEAIKKERNIN
jgi:DnaJ like chaperone protein